MLIVSFYAALLALVYVSLSIRVIRLRQNLKIGIGDSGNKQLLRAMRVHSNFAEYVPLCLILMFFLEFVRPNIFLMHLLGILLLVGRLLHAYGVSQTDEQLGFRVTGMSLTFAVIISSSLVLLYLFLIQLTL